MFISVGWNYIAMSVQEDCVFYYKTWEGVSKFNEAVTAKISSSYSFPDNDRIVIGM